MKPKNDKGFYWFLKSPSPEPYENYKNKWMRRKEEKIPQNNES